MGSATIIKMSSGSNSTRSSLLEQFGKSICISETNGTMIIMKSGVKFSQPLLLSLSLLSTILLMLLAPSNVLGSGQLKMSVSIPELVKLNDAFWLNCSHNQHQTDLAAIDQQQQIHRSQQQQQQQSSSKSMDDIYAIKWYKDDEEFYRFLPNAHPKVSIYETNGIQLDQAKSHEGNVLINKADVNSEGNYRCEILSEAPLFETVRKSKNLKVYALPVRGPRIEILDSSGRPKSPKAQEISYAVGDKIELRCNSAPSKPAARLRWYLNEHELAIPSGPQNGSSTTSGSDRLIRRLAPAAPSGPNSNSARGYDVRVTPIEYRQHYKGIYSSHSTLSLVLQQDDLINNKISFKCLASMRQEIPLRSKQLIVLMPETSSSPSGLAAPASGPLLRTRRNLAPSSDSLDTPDIHRATLVGGQLPAMDASEAHVYHRQRPQHNRHSVSRLQPQQQPTLGRQANVLDPISASNLLQQQQQHHDLRNNNIMLYIYEDSHSTLGPSIIDGPENLEAYLNTSGANLSEAGGPMEFNRATDNLEHIQLLRERSSPSPSSSSRHQKLHSQASGSSGGSGSGNNLKRFQANSLVRSPLYLDENDPMRPVISWPPLDSGKLILLGPSNTLVAIPNVAQRQRGSKIWQPTAANTDHHQQKFILPPRGAGGDFLGDDLISTAAERQRATGMSLTSLGDNNNNNLSNELLEKLVNSLNCTCTEGSVDTRLNWLINESPLEARDLRLYPTRVSPDHRQTWITIGLQPPSSMASTNMAASSAAPSTGGGRGSSATTTSSTPISLQTILAQYSRGHSGSLHATSRSMLPDSTGSLNGGGGGAGSQPTNAQIKFICQAIHSMLLYSSSEMITFDFNPPPPTFMDNNSIEKMASSPSNVIQATSASQSSSAPSRTLDLMIANYQLTLRSQTTLIVSTVSLILFIISLRHPTH